MLTPGCCTMKSDAMAGFSYENQGSDLIHNPGLISRRGGGSIELH